MSDQAEQLRRLVRESNNREAKRNGYRVISILGGHRKAGVTSIAVNCAISFARRNHAVALVDLNLENPGVAQHCRLRVPGANRRHSIRNLHCNELLMQGPCGIAVFPFLQSSQVSAEEDLHTALEAIEPLRKKYHVIIDAGRSTESAFASHLSRICKITDEFAIVTQDTPENIVATYSTIKAISQEQCQAEMHTIVNRVKSDLPARNVHERIAQSSERFLNLHVNALGTLWDDALFQHASNVHRPLMLFAPHSNVVHQFNDIAESLEHRMRHRRVA